ncbi:heterokaryon incompatibility protein-domain-containing protein [Plectosphaerella plurivora]|uniref:Heterokaryon incompatibility protein-domain-containing protein n=1 Tax=Plectosphaerella plurivora TaxID=936078 RepID=A0A9P9AC58_9PEZI|nr:heterokaryon incompatibility protein-domain-containing protein [Plectosphaerella plurivora]
MSAVEIAAPPPFEALSYTWGSPDQPRRNVSISGFEIDITESLDIALRNLRHENEIVTLWVDQVCINQATIDERMKQVALMSDVYSKATKVLIWLGEAADDSDEVMDTWLDIGGQASSLGVEDYLTTAGEDILRSMFVDGSWDPNDARTVQIRALARNASSKLKTMGPALNAWYERLWFTRVWVVQEYGLNPDPVFICGQKRVPAWHVGTTNYLMRKGLDQILAEEPSAPYLNGLRFFFDDPMRTFSSVWRRRHRYVQGLDSGESLLSLLRTLFVEGGKNAADPRDRIYGVLGLAVDRVQLGIAAEYGAKTVGEVFTQVASAFIDNGELGVLAYSQPHQEEYADLPSWVPEWRSQLRQSFHEYCDPDDKRAFSAGGDTLIDRIRFVDEPRKLGLRGYTVDVIEEVGEEWERHWHGDYRFQSFATDMRRLHTISMNRKGVTILSEKRRSEAIWRVPLVDMGRDGLNNPLFSRLGVTADMVEQQFEAFETTCELMNSEDEEYDAALLAQAKDMMLLANRYRMDMDNVIGMRPYVTQAGYLGMAASGSVPGDLVVVFKGSKVPHVVRPSEQDYTLVGEAYCDGFMDGEIVGQSAVENFVLV